MSDRSSQNLKRVRPASSDGEALARWGIGGHIARVHRGDAPAYTAEQYVEDQDKGFVLRPVERGCPRHHPTDECPVCSYPAYYRTTVRFEGEEPCEVCIECAWSVWDMGRRRFRREEGDDEPGRDSHRVDVHREAGEIAKREWRDVVCLAGVPHASIDWYELRVLVVSVRRYAAAYARSALAA